MPYFMGIDIGTGNSKGVIIRDSDILTFHSLPSGINYGKAAKALLDELTKVAGLSLSEVIYTVATGQGASNVSYSNEQISEMLCCARGVFGLFPAARTIIDIEGQTTQVMRLGKNGQIANFFTSEKCASGSGRFIDIISNVLQISLEDIGPLSLKSKNPVTFTTACAVFGESEAVSRVAEGVPAADILAGVHRAMAEKIAVMVEKVGPEEACVVCGGGGLNTGLVASLESALGIRLLVPSRPHLVTALGAALLAKEIGLSSQGNVTK